jgi:hypothetical protein
MKPSAQRCVLQGLTFEPGVQPMKSNFRLLLLCLIALALTGCKVFRSSCEAPPPPEEVATVPPLHVPEGLEAPDTRNALKIPELNEPAPPPRRSKSEPCLEGPPAYTAGWSPEERPAEQPKGKSEPQPVKKEKREENSKEKLE